MKLQDTSSSKSINYSPLCFLYQLASVQYCTVGSGNGISTAFVDITVEMQPFPKLCCRVQESWHNEIDLGRSLHADEVQGGGFIISNFSSHTYKNSVPEL